LDERAFDERYRQWARRSGELFAEASRYIPGGAGSSARTVKFGWRPYPPFMAEGSGSRLRDVDGHSYVDYLLGLGPMILGHRHPAVLPELENRTMVHPRYRLGDLAGRLDLQLVRQAETGAQLGDRAGHRPGPPTRPSAGTWPTPPAGPYRGHATATPTIPRAARRSSRRWPWRATGRTARSRPGARPRSPTKPGPGSGTCCGPPTSPPVAGFTPRAACLEASRKTKEGPRWGAPPAMS
jgi:hypothetical protein